MPEQTSQDKLDEQIIHIVKTLKPADVQQLIDLVQTVSPSKTKQEILDQVLRLEQEGKILLKPNQTPTPEKLSSYLRSNHALWYWITITLAAATTLVVFSIPEDSFPLVYARHVLGAIFVLWLPGYAFIKALFPQNLPFTHNLAHSLGTSEKNLDAIERTALSMGMSIALTPLVGLLLNYTPWGIRQTPIVLSLLALTTIFATAAIIREQQTRIPKKT